MKKIGVLAVVLATAFLFAGVAGAEMYVEGYIGGAQASNMGQAFSVHQVPPTNQFADTSHLQFSGVTEPQVIGGVKVGTWFVKEGFLGWSGYPECMKYFGFYMDFSYQNITFRQQRLGGTTIRNGSDGTGALAPGAANARLAVGTFDAQGMAATWAFMFAARYGFFPDSEVTFGRLQPYVAVGPAIMFTSLSPKINTRFVGGFGNGAQANHMSPGNQGSTNIALAVDAGIRYMALKNVSFDISFKYRYSQQSFTYGGVDNPDNAFSGLVNGVPARFTLNPTYNLFSGQVGVAYHF